MKQPAPRQRLAALRIPLAALVVGAALLVASVPPSPAAPTLKRVPAHHPPAHHLPAHQAPALQASTLSFTIMARFTAPDGSSSGAAFASHVWARGNRVRIETSLGDRPVVLLMAPPYIYKLVPASRAGVRWKNGRLDEGLKIAPGFDLQSLLSEPTRIRKLLLSKGATLIASSTVDGVPADIYALRKTTGFGANAHIFSARGYLRRSDSLPLRLEVNTGTLAGVLSWHNYQRSTRPADNRFTVPSGYAIRAGSGKPSLFAM